MKKRFLSTLLALCMMLALLPATALAAQGGPIKNSNLSWSLSDSGTLTISSGAMPDFNWSDSSRPAWYASRDAVKSVVISSGVTNISNYAFSNFANMTQVTIPVSVAAIGKYAFENCGKIQTINYAGTEAHWNAISIVSSNWPALFSASSQIKYGGSPRTTVIQSGNCNDNITWFLSSNGELSFQGTGAMPDYNWSDSSRPPWYARRGFITSVSIGSGITSIGNYAFSNCSVMTKLTVPVSMTYIGKYAFENCSKIQTISYAGSEAHWNEISVVSSNWPALYSASSEMRFAGSPNTIIIQSGACGTDAHDVRWSLDSGGMLTISGNGAMPNYNWSDSSRPPWYARRNFITGVTIESGVTGIGNYAFSNCVNLTSVAIPVSVASIGNYAFENCSKITTITYAGSQSHWNEVSYGNGNDKYLFAATVNYYWNSGPIGRYTLTLNANGGTPAITTLIVTNGNPYGALITPTRSGYTFNGWYTSATGGTPVTANTMVNLSKNQTLYAHWTGGPSTSTTMTVTFNANSGSVSTKTKTVTKGSTYGTLPTPTRSGYKFDGWYTSPSSGTKVTSATTVTKSGNHTLYAHWTANSSSTGTVKVTFNVNGGSALSTSNKTKNVTKGKTYGTLPTPTRSGFKFNGWYTKATGGTKVLSTTKVSTASSHTLYAHWAKKTYQVTFNPNGGTVLRDFNAVVNGSAYGSMPTPTYPGRHFLGWYTKATGGSKVTATTKVTLTGNKTLYAHWSTAAVTASTPKTVSKRVTIPAYYELALYSNTTTATPATYLQYTKDTPITCTRSTTLSNGTVRYYAKFGSSYYWFTYTDEMN